jgi:hypothetical protein
MYKYPIGLSPKAGKKLMKNLWRCIILAFTEERSQVLLAHEFQREANNMTPDGLQPLHWIDTCQISILLSFRVL